MVDWLRFIIKNRNAIKNNRRNKVVFDFTKTPFLQPYHLTSLACLIEEYKQSGATIQVNSKKKTEVGTFLKYTKFENFWVPGFDRNFCFRSEITNTMPIWKNESERIDSFATRAQEFYSSHSIKGKDLTPLRLTVVEALNNISDHSDSKVSGFVSTQYFKSKSELVISICDFGKGIPWKVNQYLKQEGEKQVKDIDALLKALEKGFSTKSNPRNRGFGLDTILSNVKASNGEMEIVSNRAYLSKKMQGSRMKIVRDDLQFSFPGTYLVIKLNTRKFQDIGLEQEDEMSII